jgi:hypothetical protein
MSLGDDQPPWMIRYGVNFLKTLRNLTRMES